MTGNLGASGLRKRRRKGDPMRDFDALPQPLRRWMSEAALPWSPTSCRRIWQRSRARGEPVERVLARLNHAQEQMLAKTSSVYAPSRSEDIIRAEGA